MQNAGDCVCREGYCGARCEQCAMGYTGYPNCEPCPCSPAGSVNDDLCEQCICKVICTRQASFLSLSYHEKDIYFVPIIERVLQWSVRSSSDLWPFQASTELESFLSALCFSDYCNLVSLHSATEILCNIIGLMNECQFKSSSSAIFQCTLHVNVGSCICRH